MAAAERLAAETELTMKKLMIAVLAVTGVACQARTLRPACANLPFQLNGEVTFRLRSV